MWREVSRVSDSLPDYPLPPAMTRFCGAFGKRRCGIRPGTPFGTWVSMIGLGAKVRSMERFWSMWSSATLSTSSLTGPRTASRNGSDTGLESHPVWRGCGLRIRFHAGLGAPEEPYFRVATVNSAAAEEACEEHQAEVREDEAVGQGEA